VPVLVPVDDLQAQATGTETILVFWTDRSTGEGGYELERSEEGDAFQLVGVLSANSTFLEDVNLKPDTTYVYRVRPVGSGPPVDWSNFAIATTFPDPGLPPIIVPWDIVVDSTADTSARDGVITLREAIEIATGALPVSVLDGGECLQMGNGSFNTVCSTNPQVGAAFLDAIVFDPAVFPPGIPTWIALESPLPALSTGGDGIQGRAFGIFDSVVVLDGQEGGFDCLAITSNDNAIRGLAITRCANGITLDSAHSNVIGGTAPGDGNIISGNAGEGINLDGSSSNIIEGNLIGTDETGAAPEPNDGAGVGLHFGSNNNTIGTLSVGNTIAYNHGGGVGVGSVSGNAIRGNSIFANDVAGITGNPGTDAPDLNTAFFDDTTLMVTGGQRGSPGDTFVLDIYANQSGSQGERYLGSGMVTLDSGFFAPFEIPITAAVVEGERITALATHTDGTTSRFPNFTELAVAAPEIPAGELNVRCMHSPLLPSAGEPVTIVAEALDANLNPVALPDSIEVWTNGALAASSTAFSLLEHATAPLPQGASSYGCRVTEGTDTVFSGWRSMWAGLATIPDVPVLYNGDPTNKVDIVFIADSNSYSGPFDDDFLSDADRAIRAYFNEPLFLANQSRFNFWIAGDQGSAGRNYDASRSEDGAGDDTCGNGVDDGGDGSTDEDDPQCSPCFLNAPDAWDNDLAFADVGAIIHTTDFRDCARGGQRLFSAWTDYPLELVVRHETGHAPFGLADEYCCDTGYFQPNPEPNVYSTLIACETDARDVGRFPSACRQIAKGGNTVSWWTSDPASDDLMVDNGTPRALDERRINWKFNECDQGRC